MASRYVKIKEDSAMLKGHLKQVYIYIYIYMYMHVLSWFHLHIYVLPWLHYMCIAMVTLYCPIM